MTPAITVDSATRTLGGRRVLDGVGFEVAAGEIFAVIGPNGAGKTTLVGAICGRVRLDSGEIRVGGAPAGSAAARGRLGLVPQGVALYEHLTARENLEVFGRLAGLGREAARRAALGALERIGLADRANDITAKLSGGMKRRLNIAAGMLDQPAVLLLDEPTVGVDVVARERIHELLRSLRAEGMAVLLTTHDLDQTMELADRVAVLSAGRLVAIGAPRALIEDAFGHAREPSLRSVFVHLTGEESSG